jgi:hypothetical protein
LNLAASIGQIILTAMSIVFVITFFYSYKYLTNISNFVTIKQKILFVGASIGIALLITSLIVSLILIITINIKI